VDKESGRVFSYEIREESQDVRLDVFLTSCSIGLSRSRIHSLIKGGNVLVNDTPSRPSHKLKAGDRVLLHVPPSPPQALVPEKVEFDVIHEDESLIVLNKPPGVVVHPAPGHATGTLVHGLLQHCRGLSQIGDAFRPGIVHRLDKDTSGIMVVAKSDHAYSSLVSQFKGGSVKKEYLAIIHGRVKGDDGTIDLPISRHPKNRKKMSVAPFKGRQALTLWHKIDEFEVGFSLLMVSIKTGRTHQIRVHLSHIGHPVTGDPVYGYGRKWWRRHPLYKQGLLPIIERQMLHSRCLGLIHPDHGHYVEFEAPLPDDMERVLRCFKRLNSQPQANKNLDIGRNAAILIIHEIFSCLLEAPV